MEKSILLKVYISVVRCYDNLHLGLKELGVYVGSLDPLGGNG